ncbi:MAG: RlmE family RNA methyltransferase [Methylacidiphilales bacterium]|nr:RlmE family RNA methyltransferase [Candidatus Methylacidiphilales bacterium]
MAVSSKSSSSRWKQRQQSDHYVKKAQQQGLVSRAYFKLEDLNNTHMFIKPNSHVLDLGAAPGGWSCFVLKKIVTGTLVSVDLLPMKKLNSNHVVINGNFGSDECLAEINNVRSNKLFDVVLCDASPNISGIQEYDNLRFDTLIKEVLFITSCCLIKNGYLIIKIFDSENSTQNFTLLKSLFKQVKPCKPDSSRKESKERYYVCVGFLKKE